MANQNPPRAQANWTNGLVWVSAILLLLVVSRNLWLSRQHYSQLGAIRCDEPIFNFGTAKKQDLIKHSFQLVNVSKFPLTISKVATSCHCTTTKSELIGNTIVSGEKIEIPAILDLSDAKPNEPFESIVYVEFEGTPTVSLRLWIKGQVE